jgi:GNAT superfamily N-acetyltransferase
MTSVRFSIRTATLADADPVSRVLLASYQPLLNGHYDDALLARALPLVTRANPRLLSSKQYYVAESEEGRCIGCGGWTRERPSTGDAIDGVGHIRHFATAAEWSGLGVGKALLSHSIRSAEKQGVFVLECLATRNAEGFYMAAGFRRIGPIDVSLGDGVALPSLLMRREASRAGSG